MNYLFIFRFVQATLAFILIGVFLNFFFSKERTSIRDMAKYAVQSAEEAEIIVFPAKKVITMDPTYPVADTVAVKNGKIFYIGKISNIKNIVAKEKYYIDNSFRRKIIIPGIVDAGSYLLFNSIVNSHVFEEIHIHNTLRGEKDFKQLKNIFTKQVTVQNKDTLKKPVIIYSNQGLDFVRNFLSIEELDKYFADRAVLIWNSLAAEGYYNSAFKELIQKSDEGNTINSSLEFIKEMAVFYNKEAFKSNLLKNMQTLSSKGITTAVYTNFGAFNSKQEIEVLKELYNENNIPLRLVLRFSGNTINGKNLIKEEQELAKNSLEKIYYTKSIDLFLEDNLTINGKVKKVNSYKEIKDLLEPLWVKNYNVRVSLDDGVLVSLDDGALSNDVFLAIKHIQEQYYRADSKFIIGNINHLNYSFIRHLSHFNVFLSVNGSYFSSLLNSSYEKSYDFTTELNALDEFDVKYNINTDVAPVNYYPFSFVRLILRNKNNMNIAQQNNSELRVKKDVNKALMLLTVVPAQILSIDIEAGSIEKNKFADFVVLDKDPYGLKYGAFPSLGIEATILGGKVYKLSK